MLRQFMMKSGGVALLVVAMACGTTEDGVDGDGGNEGEPVVPTDCESVEVTFDLTGSDFTIEGTPLGAGDTVAPIGPGTAVLRFSTDHSGDIVDGPVTLVSYNMDMIFSVSNVDSDMATEAGTADGCGAATGNYADWTLGWSTSVSGYHSSGTITCNGSEMLCGLAGMEKGAAVAQDTTTEQPFNAFVFDPDAMTFGMERVEIPNDKPGETFLTLVGKESSRAVCGKLPVCN